MSSEQETLTPMPVTWRARAVDYLGLERNVAVASAAVFLLGLGEELWKKFLPKYLEALGAGAGIIGLFGTAEDFFDAIYQYPGGGKAAITGDFVRIASEVNPVIRALRQNGIEVTALHRHMLVETPRLFFMHFWANDDAQKLARGLRAALDEINLAKHQTH